MLPPDTPAVKPDYPAPEPPPDPPASGALRPPLRVRAPEGVLPPRPGYTLGAYRITPAGEERDALEVGTYGTLSGALAALEGYRLQPAKLPAWATHLCVHDGRGREHDRRPVLRVA